MLINLVLGKTQPSAAAGRGIGSAQFSERYSHLSSLIHTQAMLPSPPLPALHHVSQHTCAQSPNTQHRLRPPLLRDHPHHHGNWIAQAEAWVNASQTECRTDSGESSVWCSVQSPGPRGRKETWQQMASFPPTAQNNNSGDSSDASRSHYENV